MYNLKSNNSTHALLEKNDIKIELISNLTPYNKNGTSDPVDSNFMDFKGIKNKYDILLLNLYFTSEDYGENKIIGNCIYPMILFDNTPVTSKYNDVGFMSAEYISANTVTRDDALKYSISLLKVGSDKVLTVCTNSEVMGSLYGIKL